MGELLKHDLRLDAIFVDDHSPTTYKYLSDLIRRNAWIARCSSGERARVQRYKASAIAFALVDFVRKSDVHEVRDLDQLLF